MVQMAILDFVEGNNLLSRGHGFRNVIMFDVGFKQRVFNYETDMLERVQLWGTELVKGLFSLSYEGRQTLQPISAILPTG